MNFLICLIAAIATVGLVIMFIGLIGFLMELNVILGTIVVLTFVILVVAFDIYNLTKE